MCASPDSFSWKVGMVGLSTGEKLFIQVGIWYKDDYLDVLKYRLNLQNLIQCNLAKGRFRSWLIVVRQWSWRLRCVTCIFFNSFCSSMYFRISGEWFGFKNDVFLEAMEISFHFMLRIRGSNNKWKMKGWTSTIRFDIYYIVVEKMKLIEK